MKTLALVVVVGACSSNYMPRSRGRVAVTIQDGMINYVRDGQAHPHGWIGGGLVDAVAGNRAAEQAANEYHDRILDGILMTTVGALCLPATLGYALVEGDSENGLGHRGAEIAGAVGLGCTVLLFVGASYAASAEPYRWDAINLFNDGAELPPTAQLVPRTAPAKSSLEMR